VQLPCHSTTESSSKSATELKLAQLGYFQQKLVEFKGIDRVFAGIKILLALLATGDMVTVRIIACKESEQEPIRQRIKQYKNKALEFNFAADSAY
jgi:hypothetical protein